MEASGATSFLFACHHRLGGVPDEWMGRHKSRAKDSRPPSKPGSGRRYGSHHVKWQRIHVKHGILVNGVAVPTTYQSATSVVAQISGPGWFQRQSLRPGTEPDVRRRHQCRDPDTRSDSALTATNPGGTNTGTARLGVPVNFSAVNTDTAHSGGAWTLKVPGR